MAPPKPKRSARRRTAAGAVASERQSTRVNVRGVWGMKIRKTAVLALMVVLAVAVMAGCSASVVMLDAGDSGGEVQVGIGQTLDVTLESNPSTGYSWQVVEVPGVLEQVGEATFATEAAGDVVGAAGTETLQFTALGAGTGTLLLEYRRPWETDAIAEEVFEITVTVK